MKLSGHGLKYAFFIYIIFSLVMGYSECARAELYGVSVYNIDDFLRTFSVVIPGSLHSAHSYQCDPKCLNQDNGGMGWQIGPVGHIEFTNSFWNRGYWDYVEFPLIGWRNDFFKTGILIRGGPMGGYIKKGYAFPKKDAGSVVWPRIEIGLNPFQLITDTKGSGFFTFNFFEFITSPKNKVDLWWLTFEMRF